MRTLPPCFWSLDTIMQPRARLLLTWIWGEPLPPLSYSPSSFSSVRSLSPVWLFVTPWTAARQASLPLTNSRSLLRLMSIESLMPSNHVILLSSPPPPPSIFPSIRVFSDVSVLWINWSFNFSISPSNEHLGLIFFRVDWLDLLAV